MRFDDPTAEALAQRAESLLGKTPVVEVAKGWTVDPRHIYVDDVVSGAEWKHRPGFNALLAALEPRPPFGVLIVSELSRIVPPSPGDVLVAAAAYRYPALRGEGVEVGAGQEAWLEALTPDTASLLWEALHAADLDAGDAAKEMHSSTSLGDAADEAGAP